MIDEASDESDQSSAVQSIPVIEAYQQAVALPDTVSRRKAWIAAVFFNFLKVITVAGMQSVAVYVLEAHLHWTATEAALCIGAVFVLGLPFAIYTSYRPKTEWNNDITLSRRFMAVAALAVPLRLPIWNLPALRGYVHESVWLLISLGGVTGWQAGRTLDGLLLGCIDADFSN